MTSRCVHLLRWAARSLQVGFLGLLLVALAGCAPGLGDVSGTVTFEGKPIPWGRISFVSEVGKKPVLSSYIRMGKYEIKGCPAGLARISVESFSVPAADTKLEPKEMAKGFAPPPRAEQPPAEAAGQFVEIPARYGNSQSSELEYQVTRGPQTKDFPLTP